MPTPAPRAINYQLITLSDARKLEWADNGIESNEALILMHGTTMSLDAWGAWLELAGNQGVRAISISRPGIGQSTRNQGRRIKDDAADVRELVEQLGISKFVAIGWSGGGGRAIGSTFIAGCVAAHTIAGIPSQDPTDERWMAVVKPERHEKGTLYRANWDAMMEARSASFEEDRAVPAERMLEILEQYLPHFEAFEADYQVFAEDFARAIRRGLEHGPEADGDDYQANIQHWGFNIDDVPVPVTIWHGELDDDVEVIYGEYNHSRISGSKFVRLPDLGHVDIMVEARDQILAAAIDSLRG